MLRVRDNHYTKETGKISEKNEFSVPQNSSFLTLFLKFWAATFCSEQVSLPRNGSERNSDSLFLYLFHGREFRVVFSSAEGFGHVDDFSLGNITFYSACEKVALLLLLTLR